MAKRGTAKLVDFSFVDKKEHKRKRYYIYISTPELVEDPEFPFTKDDTLLIQVEDGKIIIEKL